MCDLDVVLTMYPVIVRWKEQCGRKAPVTPQIIVSGMLRPTIRLKCQGFVRHISCTEDKTIMWPIRSINPSVKESICYSENVQMGVIIIMIIITMNLFSTRVRASEHALHTHTDKKKH